ncbi:arginine/serine-rich coiled-coil protein 2-like isoform X2 [Limulus polyphemus]|uniref:Arginine/serine-rich coiled-coil protein 2-like isoform X2 n=1 Tax=Limulus polyphemus TaxID=6850 RepID=A0ABM1BFS3_LIMPO|nr:arginine/serine-rich coiled-coil protein 2-like isoform X2 [Limulus polyphemus]
MFGSEKEMENKEAPEGKSENTKEQINEVKNQEEDLKKQSVEEVSEKNDSKDNDPENDKTVKKRHDRSPSNSSSDSSRGKSRSCSKSRERRHRKSKSRERSRLGGSRSRRTRSRSRSPRKGSDKRRRRSRSRTRSHSRGRYRIGHGRSPPRRYRSRSRGRRSRSRDRYRRDRSRERSYGGRDRKGRHSPRRSRSRSKSKQMYRQGGQIKLDDKNSIAKKDSKEGDSKDSNSGPVEKPSNLPLNDVGSIGMTPQMALQQQMAAMSAKAQALTGISLPKYYNPAAVNPLKYAEQQQKRKLLWQATKEKEKAPASSTLWEKLSFSQDQDGKMTAKFRKLMGIKEEGGDVGCSESVEGNPQPQTEDEALKQQESLFRDLDQQYEIARMSTHTHRGVGLGYSSQPTAFFPPAQK